MSASALTVRLRTRRGYVREACGYTTWEEWQVVEGRRVLYRGDLEGQARAWARGYEDGLANKAPGAGDGFFGSYRLGYEAGSAARAKLRAKL